MKKYQNIKNFRLIDAPVNRDKTQAEINIGAYFLESDDGQDWYECQSLFSDDTAKIMSMRGLSGVLLISQSRNEETHILYQCCGRLICLLRK